MFIIIYIIIIVNKYNYINNNNMTNRSLIPLALNIMLLGPYKFHLPATVDHHGLLCTVVNILFLSIAVEYNAVVIKLRDVSGMYELFNCTYTICKNW